MVVDSFQARVDQQYKYCLDCFPEGNIADELKEKLWHLCIQATLAHTNAQAIITQVAANVNADLWSTLGEMTDTLKTTKPDFASLNHVMCFMAILIACYHLQ